MTAETKTFFVTVGQRYRRESHPVSLHPGGVALVRAPLGICQARSMVVRLMGGAWSDINEFDQDEISAYYPCGVTHVISESANGVVTIKSA